MCMPKLLIYVHAQAVDIMCMPKLLIYVHAQAVDIICACPSCCRHITCMLVWRDFGYSFEVPQPARRDHKTEWHDVIFWVAWHHKCVATVYIEGFPLLIWGPSICTLRSQNWVAWCHLWVVWRHKCVATMYIEGFRLLIQNPSIAAISNYLGLNSLEVINWTGD